MKVRILAMAGVGALLCLASAAEAGPAQCRVEATDAPVWSGTCQLLTEADGSFGIVAIGDLFPRRTTSLAVRPTGPDTADVVAFADGALRRWGTARRSPDDRNCWIGEDFRLCAMVAPPPMAPPLPADRR